MNLFEQAEYNAYTVTELGATPEQVVLVATLSDKLWTPQFSALTDTALELVSKGEMTEKQALAGLVAGAVLFRNSASLLSRDRAVHLLPDIRNDKSVLEEHLANVLGDGNVVAGTIKPVPEGYETTRAFGRQQVEAANTVFSNARFRAGQHPISWLNYATVFSGLTMTDLHTQVENNITAIDQGDPNKMPHLQIGNEAIARTVVEYAKSADVSNDIDTINIVDFGSGSGATTGAMLRALAESEHTTPITITLLEGTKAYADFTASQLPSFMADTFGSVIGDIKTEEGLTSRNGTITVKLIFGDGSSKIDDTLDRNPRSLNILASNYARHRLTSVADIDMAQSLASVPNSVGIFSDLQANQSYMPNRAYFNLAVNGPLNTGNQHLRSVLNKAGFEDAVPIGRLGTIVGQELAGPLNNRENDAFFCIMAHGIEARYMLAV